MVLSSLGTELAAGTTLYRAGDAAEHMHVVVRGDVSVLIAKDKEDEEEDVEVSRLRSGQTFGEEDLLAGSK
ncbi:cyclic nucleotide-binding domain, partial [Haematococcus lacustris]